MLSSAPRREHSSINLMCAALCAVASDAKKDIDSQFFQEIDHCRRILRAARGAQNRAAFSMNILDHFHRQWNRRLAVLLVETQISVPNTQNIFHAVVHVQFQENRTNDVVQSGTQSAAGHNGRLGVLGIEKDFFPGPGFFEHISDSSG